MSSSLGLKLSLSPQVAAKLRESEPEKQETTDETNTTKEQNEDIPKISIDLERLVGYKPELDELESIKSQLLNAMWTRYQEMEREEADTNASERNEPPPDFDFQVVDLLESGVAHFSSDDTTTSSSSSSEETKNHLSLSYPPTIIISDGKSLKTHKIWKETVTCPSNFIDNENTLFVPRLWKYLAYCSRNLDWKYKMSLELGTLVKEEQSRIDYDEWTSTQRKAKLDQLYSIRETIFHQVDLNKSKYDELVEDREKLVEQDMQQYQKRQAVGNSELSFPEEFQWLGLKDEPHQEEEDDWGLLDDDDDSYMNSDGSLSGDESSTDTGYATDDSFSDGEPDTNNTSLPVGIMEEQELLEEGYECDNDEKIPKTLEFKKTPIIHEESSITEAVAGGEVVVVEEECQEPQAILTDNLVTNRPVSEPFRQRKERMRRAKQRKRQQKKEAKRQAEKERLEKLRQEIRQKHTTKDLIIAQTMYEALSKKLENVEELLESLQDEEWQAEEEAEEVTKNKQATDSPKSESSFSLLDQILAMILGTTPVQRGVSPKDHYQFIKKEHEAIVNEWKNYFGRLPQSIGSNSRPMDDFNNEIKKPEELPSPSELRLQLGITDNDNADWDVEEDLEESKDIIKKEEEEEVPMDENDKLQPTKPKVVGLRPGGSIAR